MNRDSRVSVLVADHNRWSRHRLASVLSESGLTVYEASNGFSAERMALELAPQVLIVGSGLPDLCAAELMARVRSDPATRHTAIVGTHEEVDADASLALPWSPFDLLATVVTALESRRQVLAAAPMRSVMASPRDIAPFIVGASRATSRTRNGGLSGKVRFSSDIDTL